MLDAVLDVGARPRRGRRGLRPVRRPGRRSIASRDDRALLVVRTFSKTWSMAAARLGYLVGPVVAGRPARDGRAAVPPRRGQAGRRPRGAAVRRRDGTPGRLDRRGARPAERRARRPRPRRVPVRRQLRAVPHPQPRRRRRVAAPRRRRCADPRLQLAGHASTGACASPSVSPPRTTASSPPLAAAIGRALDEPRRPTRAAGDEGDVGRGLHRPRRHRSHRLLDRHPVLRPHARPARSPRRLRSHRARRGRPAHRHPPHGRGRRDHAR